MIRFALLRLKTLIGLTAAFYILGVGLYFAPAGEERQTEFYSHLCLSAAAVLTIVLLAGFIPMQQRLFINRPTFYSRLRFPIMAVIVIAIGLLLHTVFNSYFLPLTQTLSGIGSE